MKKYTLKLIKLVSLSGLSGQLGGWKTSLGLHVWKRKVKGFLFLSYLVNINVNWIY